MAGFWNDIMGRLRANITNQRAESSPEYKNAFNAANQSIGQTQELANQYTGNAGYENSLAQAGKGAGLLANQAVGTATSGARASGMSKAQAAQMGLQNANNAYANAFQNQQNMAQGMGQNAVSAQQGQAGQAASEKQAVYDRARGNANVIGSGIASLAGKLM